MRAKLKWACKNARWFAQSPSGLIWIYQRDLGNRGIAWQIKFPNGKGFRASTLHEAKLYAEDQYERVASNLISSQNHGNK